MTTGRRQRGTIGRAFELESIARFVAIVPDGACALVFEGEAGIGKTTLLEEAVTAARRASFTVMCSRPVQAEAGLPYAGLADLFAEVSDEIISELPGPQSNALKIALLRTEPAGPLQQRAVGASVLSVLRVEARSRPVVIAVDDVQWLDMPSRRVLQFAVRRLAASAVGLLLARRAGGAVEDPLELGAALPAERLERVTVGPLDLQALDRLLRKRLRATVAGPALRRIERTSAGNPFFAIELGRTLLDADATPAVGQPLRPPRSLSDLLGARIGRLPRSARDALLVASALSRPTVDLVRRASARPDTAVEALGRAEEASLIVVTDGAVRFAHPLLASVVYSGASPPELRRLHKRLAGLVAGTEERARHLGLSATGPDPAVAAALDHAAGCAAARGAPDAAAALLEQATRLTPSRATQDVLRRRIDAGDQHVASGDTARARVLLEDVSSAAEAGTTRARALHRLARVRVLEGAFTEAPPLLRQALEEVEDDRALRAAIERDMTLALAQVGKPSEALAHARAGLLAAEACGQEIPLAEALDHLCMTEFLVHGRVHTGLLDRAFAVDQRVGPAPLLEHPGMTTGRFPLALTLKWMDRFAAARDLLRSVYREHSDHGDEGSLAPVVFVLGELECWAGDWDTARRLADEGHELASRTGQAVAERMALTLDAMLQARRGDVDAARFSATAGLALSEAAGDRRYVIRNLGALGVLELSLGKPADAVEPLERALELETGAGYDPAVLRIRPDVVEALVGLGRVDEARRVTDQLEARRSGGPWTRATAARCRGLVAGAGGDLALAHIALDRALREHERLPQPFELARTLLAMGNLQRRTKHKRAARESLERARTIFHELGARPWVDRTRAELGRIGGRAASRFELTPTEERVAELVADGLTNREIAGSLFMSVKTVEANLTRIFRKADVHSRRQLARWMRARSDRRPAV